MPLLRYGAAVKLVQTRDFSRTDTDPNRFLHWGVMSAVLGAPSGGVGVTHQ